MSDDTILTDEEVAGMLGCEVSTVRTYFASGALLATKPGRHWICLRSHVLDFIDTRSRAEAAARRGEGKKPPAMASVSQKNPLPKRQPPALPSFGPPT